MSHPFHKTRIQRRLRLPAKFPAERIDPDALVQVIVDLFPADEVERLARLGRQWALPQPMAELAVRLEAHTLDPNLSRERFRREWMA